MTVDDYLFPVIQLRLHLPVEQCAYAFEDVDVEYARFTDADKICFGKLPFKLIEPEIALVNVCLLYTSRCV